MQLLPPDPLLLLGRLLLLGQRPLLRQRLSLTAESFS